MIQEFGGTTFLRGRAYAEEGRVVRRVWAAPDLLVGMVQGNGAQPYEVSVRVRRASNGVLVEAEGDCTCPVGYQCKHCVAVLCAGDLASAVGGTAAPAGADWERRAQPGTQSPRHGRGRLRHQFGAAVRGGGLGHRGPVRHRPSSGHQAEVGALGPHRDQLGGADLLPAPTPGRGDRGRHRALGELLAMVRSSEGGVYWMPRGDAVRLENVNSRRLWDLLDEIVEVGAALVWAGREGGQVSVAAPAETRVDLVADGHRVLVFSQFTRFLSLARQRIVESGIDHCYLDGRTRKRAEVIERFRQGEAPVFLISLKAGGFGLNLTEADYCILLDPWWNPAVEAQAVDRAHRIGQTRKVIVYRMVARDTIEEKVMALKAKKAALFANVMDAGDFAPAGLSADDIRVLLEA